MNQVLTQDPRPGILRALDAAERLFGVTDPRGGEARWNLVLTGTRNALKTQAGMPHNAQQQDTILAFVDRLDAEISARLLRK